MLFDPGRVGRQTATKSRAITDPGIYTSPTLDLRFAERGVLDPRITFTRASSASYFDSNGVMQSAANNVARFDYDPVTLVARGLLIEEQRTNSIRNNTMVGAVVGTPGTLPSSGWSVFASNGLATNVIATGTINGIAYIDLQFIGTTSSTFYVLALDSVGAVASPGQIWAASMYVALVGGSLANVTGLSFDHRLTGDGVLGTTFVPNATLTRITSIQTAAASTTADVPGISLSFSSGVAINFTLRIGLPQLELGAFVTSAIPTTNAAVVRQSDVATMTDAALFLSSAATLVIDAEMDHAASAATNTAWVTLDDTTVNNMMQFLTPASQAAIRWVCTGGGVSSIALGDTTLSPLPAIFHAVLVSELVGGSARGYLNGSLRITGASHNLIGMTRLRFGTGGIAVLTGHIRRVQYFPRALLAVEV